MLPYPARAALLWALSTLGQPAQSVHIRRFFQWLSLSENFNKEIAGINKDTETRKKNQSKIRSTITEIKNILKEINSKLDKAEN